MTPRFWGSVASVACALALGVGACGSSSSSGTGGSGGGIAATGGASGVTGGASGAPGGAPGTGGTPGTGGSGVGGAPSCGDLPACVASLVAACPLAASTCLVFGTASGNVSTSNICFGNGVKVVHSVTNDPNTGAGSVSNSVTKNGTVCYTLDGTFNSFDAATAPQVLSFKNAAGVEVAIFSSDTTTYPNPTTVTCTGGQPVMINSFGDCGMPNDPEPQQCLGGNCTAP